MSERRKRRYVMVTGQMLDVGPLTPQEKNFLVEACRRYSKFPDWNKFASWWWREFDRAGLKDDRPIYRICQDLEGRLGIAQGYVAEPDYRQSLSALIGERFGSRNRFCRKTGLDPGQLSRVLDGRGDLSLKTLTKILKTFGAALVVRPPDLIRAETAPEAARKVLAVVG